MTSTKQFRSNPERGTAVVEFAIIAGVFFTLLIGIMEMGRVLFTWNTAVEATRLGARTAVVCDMNDATIKTKMQSLLPTLQSSNITINYSPGGCTASTCETVSVGITGLSVPTAIPFVPLTLTLPGFTTTMTRESLQSTFNSVASPIC